MADDASIIKTATSWSFLIPRYIAIGKKTAGNARSLTTDATTAGLSFAVASLKLNAPPIERSATGVAVAATEITALFKITGYSN